MARQFLRCIEKNLGSLNQVSAGQIPCRCPADAMWMLLLGGEPVGHLQVIWGWPLDASPRNSEGLLWKNRLDIYKPSTGHLGVACRCLSKTTSLWKLADALTQKMVILHWHVKIGGFACEPLPGAHDAFPIFQKILIGQLPAPQLEQMWLWH